jgi:hypothetical protein
MKIGPIQITLQKENKAKAEAEEKRPVKFVPDGVNSWRVVWADEVAS